MIPEPERSIGKNLWLQPVATFFRPADNLAILSHENFLHLYMRKKVEDYLTRNRKNIVQCGSHSKRIVITAN